MDRQARGETFINRYCCCHACGLSSCTCPPILRWLVWRCTAEHLSTQLEQKRARCNAACRLEAAYEAAVAQLGGLAAATPKPVYEALQDEFPELTLQVGWGEGPKAEGRVRAQA